MRLAKTFLAIAVLVGLIAVGPALCQTPSETSRFDGAWKLTLTCPPSTEDKGAKGYKYFMDTEITNGQLRATHGAEGQPGWELLRGHIAPDGTALLTLEGIVDNPEHAIGGYAKGRSFTYEVAATFQPNSGTGQRTTGRACDFRFSR